MTYRQPPTINKLQFLVHRNPFTYLYIIWVFPLIISHFCQKDNCLCKWRNNIKCLYIQTISNILKICKLSFVLWKHLCASKWRQLNQCHLFRLKPFLFRWMTSTPRTHSWQTQVRLMAVAQGSELEEVDEVLRGNGHQAALRIVGSAWMAAVLEDQSTTTPSERKETRKPRGAYWQLTVFSGLNIERNVCALRMRVKGH